METKYDSFDVAAALSRKMLIEVGKQVIAKNRKGSYAKQLARARYIKRFLDLKKQGGR